MKPGADRVDSSIHAPQSGNLPWFAAGGLLAHGVHEILVGFGRAHFVQQKFHTVDGRHGSKNFAQNPHAVEHIVGQQQVFLAGARAVDVDGGEDAFFRKVAVEVDFHVAGYL